MGNAPSVKKIKEFERVSDYKKEALADKIVVETAKAEKERKEKLKAEGKLPPGEDDGGMFGKMFGGAKGSGDKEADKAALKKKLSTLGGLVPGSDDPTEKGVEYDENGNPIKPILGVGTEEDPAPPAGNWENGRLKYPQTETRFDLADYRRVGLIRFRGDPDNNEWDHEEAMLPPDPEDKTF